MDERAELQSPAVPETLHERIERERKAVAPSRRSGSKVPGSWATVRDFRDYARGKTRKTLNADQVILLQSVLRHDFCDNVLRKILWEHSNRLRISRFDVEDTAVDDFLYDTWVKNQLPDLFADSTFATIRDGNHAIGLAWIPNEDADDTYGGRVLLSRERWWDGIEGVFIMYGDNGQAVYAVKEWLPLERNAKKRRTVYFPDHIRRFVKGVGGWDPYSLPGDELFELARGVVPWIKQDGSPIGIPVVHLPNGSDDDTPYGASLLDGGALAFQDQINAIQHDITAAAMMNGSPQTFSKGFSLPIPPGETVPARIRTGPGMHHHIDEPTGEFGTIEPGDLSQLGSAYSVKLSALCRMTNTPMHVITGEWPSGEAIFRAEMPLVQSVRKLAESLGPAWASVMHRATEIQNTFGRLDLDEDALIRTIFEPPEQRDPITLWTVADKAAPYVSEEEVLRLAGYTPDKIEMIMAERKAEKAESTSFMQSAFGRPGEMDALLQLSGQSLEDPTPLSEVGD